MKYVTMNLSNRKPELSRGERARRREAPFGLPHATGLIELDFSESFFCGSSHPPITYPD